MEASQQIQKFMNGKRKTDANDATKNDVALNLNEPAKTVEYRDGTFWIGTQHAVYKVATVLITTGGLSFPGCGTTGDGYAWCQQFGHSIVPTVPALVPLKTPENSWTRELQGVTLEDLELTVIDSSGVIQSATRGSTLFTHLGVSGPAAMNISKVISYAESSNLNLQFNFLPEFNREKKLAHLSDLCQRNAKRQLSTALKELLPSRTINVLLHQANINPAIRCAEISKTTIRILAEALHTLSTTVTGTLGFTKAEVTAGGIELREVHSQTMESKCQRGLFLAGEILNLDGPIGGYNFTAAFATGFLAGQNL